MIIQDDSEEDGDYYENDKKYLLNRIHDTDEANKSKKKKEHTEDASGKEGNQAYSYLPLTNLPTNKTKVSYIFKIVLTTYC